MHAETNVLGYVLIYLAAMVVVVPLAKRFGLGVVLGYLLAGVLIGPFGLGLTSENKSIGLFAELGVVLMLFTIGLELDLKKLWAMRNQVFGFGAMQMALCGLALAVGVFVLGLPALAAGIVGLTLALSSTAVAVQLMNDRNLMGTQTGKAAFGVLLFQDMAAIPLLIATSVLFPSAGAPTFKPLYALAAVAVVVLVGRFVIGYGLRWIATNGSRELFVGAALLLVIAVMELMAWAGVSAGLGAFIAGVLLASSEYRHELEADLEPFKGLFLGLFFITIGAAINLDLLRQHWALISALLLGFMALKFAFLYLQAWTLRLGRRGSLAFGTLLGQGGEFGFVIAALAIGGGMVSAEQGAWLNLIIALSIAVSPLLMKLQDGYATKFITSKKKKQAMDTDMEHNRVIIAGFGRFGQIVGRLLLSNGVHSTVLDHDSEHTQAMRQLGFKVYYGDAARLDLLEVAGAHKARVLVVAVDEKETINRIVELAQKHFPKLHIMARAKDVPHVYELKRMGVEVMQRELFESSLMLGRAVLERLGHGAYEAREMADSFRRTNLLQITEFAKLAATTERKEFMSAVRRSREELERQLREEMQQTKVGYEWQDAKRRQQEVKS